MPEKKVTLKSIAQELGVSLGTVHRAIYHKEGVSEETRKNILKYVEEMDYKVNLAASALKRGAVRIAAVVPQELLDGVERAASEFGQFNVELVKHPYTEQAQQGEALEALSEEEISGVITCGGTELDLGKLASQGVPVALVRTDAPDSGRLCCVAPRDDVNGRMAAELLSNFIQPGGRVLVMAGSRGFASHQASLHGFLQGMGENSPRTEVLELYDFDGDVENNRMQNTLREYLEKFEDIRGVYANNQQGSLLLGETVQGLGKSGRIKAVASGLSRESAQLLRDGAFQAVLHDDPDRMAGQACRLLLNYLGKEQAPPKQVFLEAILVIKGNLDCYLANDR